MKVISVEESKLTASALADMAKGETVILTRNGRPIAAVKNVSGSDWESLSLASNPQFMSLIEESLGPPRARRNRTCRASPRAWPRRWRPSGQEFKSPPEETAGRVTEDRNVSTPTGTIRPSVRARIPPGRFLGPKVALTVVHD